MSRMGLNKTVIFLTGGLLVLVFSVYFFWQNKMQRYQQKVSKNVEVVKTWELPDELDEVSGIAFFGDEKMAAIQDEDGILFIYDLKSSSIEKEVKFAGSGDYEGLAVKENTAYVVKSNGDLYVIKNFLAKPEVKEYSTPINSDNDIEGLCLDRNKERLLLIPKEENLESDDYKAIYAVNLSTMEFQQEPAFKLTFQEEIFDGIREEEIRETYYPSEVFQNFETGEIFILEAETPRLLVLDPSGKAKELHYLDKENFPQPEGMTFDGKKLYISNEGNPANIHQVEIR